MLMTSAHLVLQPRLPKESWRPVVRHMIHKYKYFFDTGRDFDVESVQDSSINTEDGTNTPLGSLNPPLFITPRYVFMNAHIHRLAHTSTTCWSCNSRRYCEDTVAVIKFLFMLSCFVRRQILYGRSQLEQDLYWYWKASTKVSPWEWH